MAKKQVTVWGLSPSHPRTKPFLKQLSFPCHICACGNFTEKKKCPLQVCVVNIWFQVGGAVWGDWKF